MEPYTRGLLNGLLLGSVGTQWAVGVFAGNPGPWGLVQAFGILTLFGLLAWGQWRWIHQRGLQKETTTEVA